MRAALAVRDRLDPQALHVAALLDLLAPDAAENVIDRSISSLQTAARLVQRPTAVLIDLTAAYVIRAQRNQNPRDLLEAVETAKRGLDVAPRSEPLRFNLALALDQLGLAEQARQAWGAYLTIDSTSSWADEARKRRTSAVEELPPEPRAGASAAEIEAYVAAARQDARFLGFDRVLGEWGSAVLRGDTATAEERLRFAGALGDAIAGGGGDASLADAVSALRARTGQSSAIRELARAHQAYAAGRSAYIAANPRAAGGSFARVLATAGISTPLRSWATLFRAATIVQAGQPQLAVPLYRDLVEHTDAVRYPALAAHARFALGTTLSRGGNYEEPLALFRDAAHLAARSGERELLGAAHFLLADEEYALGDVPAMHASAHGALRSLRPYRRSVWLHNLLYVWAEATASGGAVRAALEIQDEGVAVATGTSRADLAAEARVARARLLAATGALKRAVEDIHGADSFIQDLPSGEMRDWLKADLLLAQASTTLRDHPAGAVADLDSVIAIFTAQRNAVRLLPPLIERAEADLALGRTAAADADLRRAVEVVDAQREAITRAPLRAALLDAAGRVFDRMVMLRIAAGQPVEALSYLEQGRASFAPVGSGRAGRKRDVLRAPPGQIALDYALVGDTLLAWVIDSETIRLTRTPVDRAGLARAIDRVRSSLELRTSDAAVRPELAALYDWLVRPVQQQLGPVGTPLVLIADGEIAGVPFAALLDTTRGRYLIEDHPFRFASTLASALRTERLAGPHERKAVLVADPAFNPATFRGLDRLPGARREVEAIAAEYPRVTVIAGTAANRAALDTALRRGGVVHFAGHAVFDDERPERSFLVLAPPRDRQGTDRLSAADIERLDLRRVHLMVLSACQTSRARSGRSGGYAGLVGALLAAGAGGVVGSLWRVDDSLTEALMVELHRSYRDLGDGAAALRAAQLRLLRSPNPALHSPAAWAAFRYTGA